MTRLALGGLRPRASVLSEGQSTSCTGIATSAGGARAGQCGAMSQSSSPFGRLPAVSCRLQEICADEAVEVAVEDSLGVPHLEVRAVVLDELVGVKHVAANGAA